MIYLRQRRGVSLCDKFWMKPLYTEVSEEGRTNKKQIFFKRISHLLFLKTETNYNILHTKKPHL
jgi:hypothetical protein